MYAQKERKKIQINDIHFMKRDSKQINLSLETLHTYIDYAEKTTNRTLH